MKDTRIGIVKTDTKLLYNLLEKTQKGELITYKTMLETTYSSNINKIRPSLMTAMRMLQRENQYCFKCVINEGYKRMTDEEIAKSGRGGIKKIRKTARKSNKVLACVNFEKLSNDAKILHNSHTSFFGAIEFAASPSKVKQIEKKVKDLSTPLSLEETLKLFK